MARDGIAAAELVVDFFELVLCCELDGISVGIDSKRRIKLL